VIDALTAHLRGIWQLAFGQMQGVRLFGAERRDVMRSFLALAIVLPAELAQKIDVWALFPATAPLTDLLLLRGLAVEALTCLVSWLGFLVVAYELCRLLHREHRWWWLVILWNWSQVVQATLALAANLPDLMGAPSFAGQIILLLSLCWAIWFDWKIVRISLAVPMLDAALFVALDAVISNAAPVLTAHLDHLISG
jgi:hypothetical protein